MKYTLRRVRLNSGGYTSEGYYFGIDLPLYWYCSDSQQYHGYVRAYDRYHAKNKIRDMYQSHDCKFYN